MTRAEQRAFEAAIRSWRVGFSIVAKALNEVLAEKTVDLQIAAPVDPGETSLGEAWRKFRHAIDKVYYALPESMTDSLCHPWYAGVCWFPQSDDFAEELLEICNSLRNSSSPHAFWEKLVSDTNRVYRDWDCIFRNLQQKLGEEIEIDVEVEKLKLTIEGSIFRLETKPVALCLSTLLENQGNWVSYKEMQEAHGVELEGVRFDKHIRGMIPNILIPALEAKSGVGYRICPEKIDRSSLEERF